METYHLIPPAALLLPPHSLGKLIEWKLPVQVISPLVADALPTRWGN